MLLLCCVAAPLRAPAQGASDSDTLVLSARDVRQRAASRSPDLRAAVLAIAAARGDLRQAHLLSFNPELQMVSPGTAPAGQGSPIELSLIQELEIGGQRGLRVEAAQRGLARTSFEVRDRARLVIGEALLAFFRLAAAEARLDVAERMLRLNDALAAAVRTQLEEGEISALEATLATVEAGRSHAQVLSARREVTTHAASLARALGEAPARPFAVVIDSLPGESNALDERGLIEAALRDRPDLSAAREEIAQAGSQARLAARDALPNLRLGAVAERNRGTGDPRVGLSVGIGLPVFNRQQGNRARSDADAERARRGRAATEVAVRAEVTEAVRALTLAREARRVYARAALAPARTNSALLDTAHRAGKITLPTLLLLRNQLLGAELGYWDTWLAEQEAGVRLDLATGALTPGADDLAPLARGQQETDR
ncbi:MAG: TolC family protein [Gemmatimonadaceae bacterium]|nr:TolC family protein [Gemmatimonadaceae bacterium]